MDQTVTSLPTGKGSVELFSEPLLCPDGFPALTLQRGRRRGVQGTLRLSPLTCWPVAQRQEEVLSAPPGSSPYYVFSTWWTGGALSTPFRWVIEPACCVFSADDRGVVLSASSILFQLLVGCYHQVHSNRLRESIYWSCCWDAKCD